MLVSTPEAYKTLDDYDFLTDTGMMMPVTLDRASGDTIAFGNEIIIRLVSKPSMNDPSKLLPAEDITIYRDHIVSFQHRERRVAELTPDQQFEWMKTLQEMGSTVQ